MIKIDLITGFLGAGKTTFIKKYAKYLMDRGNNICILENDFGAVNVDMMLLQDLQGDQCELEMVAGACDRDCHKRRFKTKLISMGMYGYDRVLIEPSGIFDVDEFFDVLYEEPLDRWYEIGNVIAVVDAKLEEDLSEASNYLLASEIANAGKIIFSKCQEADQQEILSSTEHLNRALELVGCKRRLEREIVSKPWDDLTEKDWAEIADSGYVTENYEKQLQDKEEHYTSVYFLNIRMKEEKLRTCVEQMMQDRDCGGIFRVKGFMMTEKGWIELNATHQNISIKPIQEGQEVLIVIGEGLKEDKIRAYINQGGEIQ